MTTIPVHLAQDMAHAMRDMLLFDLDPESDDPAYDAARDVLNEYERLVSGEQLTLFTGIHEEETE